LDSLSECAALSAEIILVDDGSEDNSVQICKEYAEKYGNIRLIENAHGE
jgi:glycosyltransferase involved in cell wall biosynthesis